MKPIPNRETIFPVSIFRGSVRDNQKLQNMFLPYFEQIKNQLKEMGPPEGWATNNLITSFPTDYDDDEMNMFNSIFYGASEKSIEIQSQYEEVIKSFFDSKFEANIDTLWFNYYENGEYQESHNHISSYSHVHFACIHFLSCDPLVHSPLILRDPLFNLRKFSIEMISSNYKNGLHNILAKSGDFLMIPSYLDHEVRPGPPTPGNPRVTIAFNISVTKYGSEDYRIIFDDSIFPKNIQ